MLGKWNNGGFQNNVGYWYYIIYDSEGVFMTYGEVQDQRRDHGEVYALSVPSEAYKGLREAKAVEAANGDRRFKLDFPD